MDVKNTHSITKTENSVFGSQALGAERRRSPSLAVKVLNVKKTKAMVFRMPQKKIIQPNIKIYGSNIEFVENFIFLGITINNKLNWNSHINKVTNKISKTVGILNKLRSFLPSDVLQTIYNTLILPHLIY